MEGFTLKMKGNLKQNLYKPNKMTEYSVFPLLSLFFSWTDWATKQKTLLKLAIIHNVFHIIMEIIIEVFLLAFSYQG